ncbi:MAG: VIT domain-containing protein [Myxococcota bacterium]|nr:VIT domain-containing protein [Myxococcota bacterium]
MYKKAIYKVTMILFLMVGSLLSLPAVGEASVSPGLRIMAGEVEIPLPLMSTTVEGEVEGVVARVRVTQTFVNPYDDFIEATYVFPLPETAAVNEMVMHLSDRDVVAEIKEKEEAERIYHEALDSGRTAALLNQERPNIFTQKVGNISPGDKVEVELVYVELLQYEKGQSSFVFPMVVGPRYIPGMPLEQSLSDQGRMQDTHRVPDASKITPPSFGEGETGAHRIDLKMHFRPGVAIREITSPSHQIEVKKLNVEEAIVSISKTDRVPNKDFILKMDFRGKRPKVAVLTHKEADSPGYVTVSIHPPAAPEAGDVLPKDLFFVVDNSGSMHGAPLDAAKALIIESLKNMNPYDRFTIMRFSDHVSALSSEPLSNTFSNVAKGIDFINEMAGMGGTEMLPGIRRALEGEPEPGRVRIVFFLTDGYIGNDDQILKEVKDRNTSDARLFSMGVGSSVNRHLLSSMARLGRGEMQVMRFDEDPAPFVKRFYERVRNPVLTDIEVEWEGLDVVTETPSVMPDLFSGQPMTVHGRYESPGTGKICLTGRYGRQRYEQCVNVTFPEENHRPAIASVWARALLGEWMDQETSRPGSRREDIVKIALNHNLVSKYTSFVAVDKEVARRSGEPLIPVAQRLPLPEGVTERALGNLSRYEIPPGDPFISVHAPADAQSVTAVFPFGLTKSLTYDAGRDKWRGRFLVPAGIPDGLYTVVIAIVESDGQLQFRKDSYHLDSAAEEFLTNFETVQVKAGKGARLEVDTIENADEVYAHCEGLGIHRQALNPENKRMVHWSRFLRIPKEVGPGDYSLLVVVRDGAGNRLERHLTVTVY